METEVKRYARAIQTTESIDAKIKHNVTVTVNRYTTDSSGVIVSTPAHLREPLPFHLFGEFDRQGGYAIADLLTIHKQPLFSTYVAGLNTPLFYFSGGIAEIGNYIRKGDIVFVYVDDLHSPNYFTFIVLSAPNVTAGLSSLVSQTHTTQLDSRVWGVFTVDNFKYSWQNDAQLSNEIKFINTHFDGTWKVNSISPLTERYQNQRAGVDTLIIPVRLLINQYVGISHAINYDTPYLQFNFNILGQ